MRSCLQWSSRWLTSIQTYVARAVSIIALLHGLNATRKP
jgi:hypothetical protein